MMMLEQDKPDPGYKFGRACELRACDFEDCPRLARCSAEPLGGALGSKPDRLYKESLKLIARCEDDIFGFLFHRALRKRRGPPATRR